MPASSTRCASRNPIAIPPISAAPKNNASGNCACWSGKKKLLDKIDEALEHLARGQYGWCRETGEPIGLKRLLLRPTTTLCIEAKEREELRERHQRAI